MKGDRNRGEVGSAPTRGPEQLGIVCRRDRREPSLRRHHVDRLDAGACDAPCSGIRAEAPRRGDSRAVQAEAVSGATGSGFEARMAWDLLDR